MSQDIDEIQRLFNIELQQIKSLQELKSLEVVYLGRRGKINLLLKKDLSGNQVDRKKLGNEINELKKNISIKLVDYRNKLIKAPDTSPFIDPTLPGISQKVGSLHIVSYAIEQISKIFASLGFIRMSYREIEYEYFSFDSLNMPKNHPGRDDFETFFLDGNTDKKYGKMILSPHTSSCQIREMWRTPPPIKMINIAKCYRPNWDVSHTPMFHQFESLCIDKRINMTNLKGTIEFFVKNFFGKNRQIRLRPHHFQFTEPSFEVDITCDICSGTGFKSTSEKCRVCKSGWLELAGAGMVHPKVLQEGKIDSKIFSGWAFAFGLERIMMMKEGIKLDDMRLLYSGDIKFLEQF